MTSVGLEDVDDDGSLVGLEPLVALDPPVEVPVRPEAVAGVLRDAILRRPPGADSERQMAPAVASTVVIHDRVARVTWMMVLRLASVLLLSDLTVVGHV